MAGPSRIQLVSPAVDFIDNRLSEHHRSFVDPPTHFDRILDRYVATTSAGDAMALSQNAPLTSGSKVVSFAESSHLESGTLGLHDFSDILKKFILQHPEEPKERLAKNCSIRQKTSWEEVLQVLESTGKAYLEESGVKGKIKRVTRFVGDKADVMKRITAVIPEVDYSKPILGALAFLLEAFKQTSKVRTAIQNSLEELKTKFEDIEDYLKLYSGNPKISEAVMTLSVSILKGIEDVIGFYTRNIVIKGLDAVWSGENYEQSLLECLEKVNDNGKKLGEDQWVSTIATYPDKTTTNVMIVENTVNQFRQMFESMAKDHARKMDIKQKLAEQTHKETQRLARQIELTIQNSQLQQQQLQYMHLATLPQPPKIAEPIVTQEDLIDFLGADGLDKRDIEYIMDCREAFVSRGQDRTEAIMTTSKFREWLVNASSEELLIHGNSEPQPISPLSVFSAMLVQNLRGVNKFWTVTFFCGCHPYVDYGGARIMITSLIAQLLAKRTFDLSFIKHEDVYRMDLGYVPAFCLVFGQLVQQIDTSDTVFCVIDGINVYEGREELLDDTAYTLRFLLDLTMNERNVFKIFLTSPSTTEDVRQAIEDANYLSLPQQTPGNQGFSGLKFERQLNENFET